MNYEQAEKLYNSFKNTKHRELKQALLEAAVRYANIRAQWAVISREERVDINQTRTIAHNAFIDSCNILSRNMFSSGENNSWRNILGNERSVIGDFACFLHCMLGLSAA